MIILHNNIMCEIYFLVGAGDCVWNTYTNTQEDVESNQMISLL